MTAAVALAPDSAPCSCSTCVGYCESNPGWPTPSEAALLLDAGHAGRLMLDRWFAEDGLPDVDLLMPAARGYEGTRARHPSGLAILLEGGYRRGACTFLTGEGRCAIYGEPGRPVECRAAHHADRTYVGLHRDVAATWHTDEGRAVVARWRSITGYTGDAGGVDE